MLSSLSFTQADSIAGIENIRATLFGLSRVPGKASDFPALDSSEASGILLQMTSCIITRPAFFRAWASLVSSSFTCKVL